MRHLSEVEQFWFDVLNEGELPFQKKNDDGSIVIDKDVMYEYFIHRTNSKISQEDFEVEFKSLLP
jgi:hypothetical protein